MQNLLTVGKTNLHIPCKFGVSRKCVSFPALSPPLSGPIAPDGGKNHSVFYVFCIFHNSIFLGRVAQRPINTNPGFVTITTDMHCLQ